MVITRTLHSAREWVLRNRHEGVKCPCCGQFAKIYRRRINSGMARRLITMYRTFGMDYGYTPNLPDKTHETAQLAWWGLIEDEGSKREDGGRAGWWRLTPRGRGFVEGLVTVPKYAHIYDGRLLSLDDGEEVSIYDALGKNFDYKELMSSAAR